MNAITIIDIVIAIATMASLVMCMYQIVSLVGFKKGAIYIADYNSGMPKWMQVLNVVLIGVALAVYNYFDMSSSIWASVIGIFVIYGYVAYGKFLDRA